MILCLPADKTGHICAGCFPICPEQKSQRLSSKSSLAVMSLFSFPLIHITLLAAKGSLWAECAATLFHGVQRAFLSSGYLGMLLSFIFPLTSREISKQPCPSGWNKWREPNRSILIFPSHNTKTQIKLAFLFLGRGDTFIPEGVNP